MPAPGSRSFLFIEQTDNGAALANLGVSGGLSFWKDTHVGSFYASIDVDFVHAVNNYSVAPAAGVFVDLLPITGDPSPGAVFTVGAGVPVDSATTIDYGRVNAAVGIDWGMAGDVPVAFGVFGSAGQLHLVSRVTTAGAPASFAALDETVSMGSLGPMIATEWTHPMGDTVDLTLGGRAALLGAFGSLSATQTSSIGAPFDSIAATVNVAAIAGLVEATATVNVAASDTLDFFVYGGVGARNDYFSIVNPRSGPGLDANDPTSYAPGPVRLQQSILFTAKAGIGVAGNF